jgi:hypothetical protein
MRKFSLKTALLHLGSLYKVPTPEGGDLDEVADHQFCVRQTVIAFAVSLAILAVVVGIAAIEWLVEDIHSP